MNTKRWLLASVAVFVAIGVLEFLVHGVLLSGLYKQTASVWRPEAEMRQMMWIFWAGYLVFAPFFALIYVKGYEKGKPGLGQGFRYGLYVGAMLSVMTGFGWYVILPIPPVLAFYSFLATLVEFTVLGVVAGFVYRDYFERRITRPRCCSPARRPCRPLSPPVPPAPSTLRGLAPP